MSMNDKGDALYFEANNGTISVNLFVAGNKGNGISANNISSISGSSITHSHINRTFTNNGTAFRNETNFGFTNNFTLKKQYRLWKSHK